MIASLQGILREKLGNEAVVDVNGVGYRVFLSFLSLARLPQEGEPVALRVRTVVREDALDLYAFVERAEEEMFLLLTSVSQVGPKLALAVLSGLEVGELSVALARGEVARLTKIHGVGKKTAERLVLELKDKVKALSTEGNAAPARRRVASGPMEEVVSALVNLGYKPNQAEQVAGRVSERMGNGTPFEALFREALKDMRAGI